MAKPPRIGRSVICPKCKTVFTEKLYDHAGDVTSYISCPKCNWSPEQEPIRTEPNG